MRWEDEHNNTNITRELGEVNENENQVKIKRPQRSSLKLIQISIKI